MRGTLLSTLVLMCAIRPLNRPRIKVYGYNKANVYQPKTNQAELKRELLKYMPMHIDIPVIVDTKIIFERKKNKDKWPIAPRYGDEDNLRKAINDALVDHGTIVDDRLVVGGSNMKVFSDHDMCVVEIYCAEC